MAFPAPPVAPVKMVALSLLALLLLVAPGCGYPTGAPVGACNTLTPNHNAAAQTSPSPFTITFTPANFTPGGSIPVTVTLSTTSGATFMGFLLTTQYEGANASATSRPGTFRNPPAVTKLACSNSAVTHSDRNNQSSLSFEWLPPPTSGGHIRFRATFVREETTLWKDVRATDLLTDTTADSGTGVSQPEATTGSSATTAKGQVKKDADCGSSKGCYSDCQDDVCTFLVTWSLGSSDDEVRMTLSGAAGEGSYVALGLSKDDRMGSDSVVFCINHPNGTFLSYNDGRSNELNDEPKDGLSDIEVSYADGVLTCNFSRVKAADSADKRFALDKPYTLLFATGPGSENGASYHDSVRPVISSKTASLVDFSLDIDGSIPVRPLVKLHGSLMIIAWVFAASIGIIVVRYFRNEWEDSTWFGEKIWFQVHRTCMATAFLATVSGFIVIFVEVGGYSKVVGKFYLKFHPVMGIIVTVLTIINLTMALCRPKPDAPRRPIFNKVHWIVGSGTQLTAVIAIFFGVLMKNAMAPMYLIYILAVFAGWLVFIEFALDYVRRRAHKKEQQESHEMTDISQGEPPKTSPQQKAASHKRMLLVLHILTVTGFTVTVLVVLNTGKGDN